MQEKLLRQINQITERLKEISSKLGKRNRILIAGGVAAILIVAIVGAFLFNTASGAVLFTEMTQEEAAEVVAKIGEMGVEASYNSAGSVMVPADRADELRAQLVLQGYPKSGLSYSTFSENVSALSTDYDKNAYAIYDLQDRVAGTIRHFSGVKDAVVVFALGNEDKYVLTKDKKEASAWATVYLQPGAELEADQVKGIQRLLTKSIAGLTEENVSVFDGDGRDLTMNASEDGTGGTVRLKRALETELENSIVSKLLYLLAPVYGKDNIRFSVTTNIDVKKKLLETVTYIPSEDNKGVTESETSGVEITGNGQAAAGNPGTDNNAQIPMYPNVTFDGNEIHYKDDKAFNYLVSQMKEQIQDDGGDVLDLSVSAVINSKSMTTAEINDLKRLIANTANIDTELMGQKVAVLTGDFGVNTSPEGGVGGSVMDELMRWKWVILAVVAAALLLTLVVSKFRGKRAVKVAAAEAAVIAQQAPADVLSIRLEELKKTREMELKDQIKDFAESNPEISAQLIRTWLKGGEGDE